MTSGKSHKGFSTFSKILGNLYSHLRPVCSFLHEYAIRYAFASSSTAVTSASGKRSRTGAGGSAGGFSGQAQ